MKMSFYETILTTILDQNWTYDTGLFKCVCENMRPFIEPKNHGVVSFDTQFNEYQYYFSISFLLQYILLNKVPFMKAV